MAWSVDQLMAGFLNSYEQKWMKSLGVQKNKGNVTYGPVVIWRYNTFVYWTWKTWWRYALSRIKTAKDCFKIILTENSQALKMKLMDQFLLKFYTDTVIEVQNLWVLSQLFEEELKVSAAEIIAGTPRSRGNTAERFVYVISWQVKNIH